MADLNTSGTATLDPNSILTGIKLNGVFLKVEPIVIDKPENVVKLVTIIGQLDESNVDNLAKAFYQELDNSPEGTKFLFDLQEMAFINSKGIGYTLDFFRRINAKKGRMVIARPPENVLDILELVGVTKVLEVFFTIDEAKLALVG